MKPTLNDFIIQEAPLSLFPFLIVRNVKRYKAHFIFLMF